MQNMKPNNIPKIEYIDADTLLSMPMARTPFLIPGLLPRGTHLLCGAPKTGKSWLALWLGLQVARGGEIWGESTEPHGVLYLCLEDTQQRVRDRLYKLTDTAPEGLHIATACDTIGRGFEEQLNNYLLLNSDTKLVILDTLQKIRPSRGEGANVYGADYADISALKALADDFGVTLLILHHLRKREDGADPFNMVSGSTGLTGAVDGTYLLRRERGDDCAELLITGRDVQYQSLRLRFRDFVWMLEERLSEEEIVRERLPDVLFDICEFMRGREMWSGTPTELCEALGTSTAPNAITKILGRYSEDFLNAARIGFTTCKTRGLRQIGLYKLPPPITDDSPF